MRDIKIIVCNNKIYFDNETIAEIRELPDDSDYSPCRMDLERIEATVNDGNFHNLTEVSKQIESICISYEGNRDSEYLSLDDDLLPDNSPLSENEKKILDRIASIDSIFKKVLKEAESNDDIPTLHELVRIYELVDCGVFTLKQGEDCVYKHLVNKANDIAKAIGHASPDRAINRYCKEVTNI